MISSISTANFTARPNEVLQCCGVFDSQISSERKFYQALHGLYIPHQSEDHSSLPSSFPTHLYKNTDGPTTGLQEVDLWEVPSSSECFANEYDSNHFPSAFPCLFPYGVGGFQVVHRPKPISMEIQMRQMLRQGHRIYARHEIFSFVVFNTVQRRKLCLGSRLITSRYLLPQVCELLKNLSYDSIIETLTQSTFSNARRNSGNSHYDNVLRQDPTLKKLMQLTSLANQIPRGTREYMHVRRREISATFIQFGGPHFFVTINPDDVRHPLALGLTSQGRPDPGKIVLSGRFPLYYNRLRHRLVADNPVAQAEFFDTVLLAVLESLFGFGRPDHIGLLGKVAAHYTMVEAQGKGTLHAHALIWLTDGIDPILQVQFFQSQALVRLTG